MKNSFIIAIAGLMLCSTISMAQQTLKIAAGSTATDLIVTPIHEPFEKATGIHLQSFKMPGKAAIAELGKGSLQAVITDATVESITADIKKGEISFPANSLLKAFPIMQTSSVVVIHKDNPVASLNKDQLKAIFSGNVSEWQKVGGKAQVIIVAIAEKNKGTLAEFSRKIMDNEALLKEPYLVSSDEEVKEFVAATPEAIGVLPSMAMVDASLKKPATPDISKTVSFFTLDEPKGDAKKLLDFLQGAGKAYIIKP